jgi:Carboxypeptidase regulatory-like domain/Polysaccharide lyase family 4, domain II
MSAASVAQITAPKEPPKCSVQGQVLHDPGGQPLKKATIELRPDDKEGGTSYKAISDVEGKFKFEKVDPGSYTLKLERNGFLESGKGNGSHKLTLQSGQEIKDMVLRMRPMAIITGRVLDSDGDPLPGVSVTISRYGAASLQRGVVGGGYTDDLGEYRAGNLRPGRYLIQAVLVRYASEPEAKMADDTKETAPYPTYYPGVTDKSQAVPVEVRAGDQVPINITLSYGPAYRVRGSIEGLPELRGADPNIVFRPKDAGIWDSNQFLATVKSDGWFEIPKLLPGEYRVTMFKMDGSDFHAYQAAQTVVVTDSDLDNVRLSSESDSEVRGQFRTENGEKLSWALMSVTLDSGEKDPQFDFAWPGPSTRGQFKTDGSFDIKKVPPGKYRLTLNSDSAASAFYIKSVSLGGKDVTDSGFYVSGGAWSLDAVLTSDGGTLEGVVLNEKDQPVPDALVVALPDTENRKRHDLFKKVSADQHGHFIIRGMRPGEYGLFAFDELEEDYRDPDVIKPFEDRGQTVRAEKSQRRQLVLKVIATED